FAINWDREKLYQRINKRVDFMIKEGLVDEVKSLLDKGYDRNLVSMQGIGYKEIIEYLDGKISLDEAVELIKKNTRHFAKRQLTWFRREKTVTMVNWDEYDYDKNKLLACMLKDLKEINIIKDK
ncbi:MAG: tRNA (adenosine(37)-N6)-dimethylallyltransferase MiaA, partial [Eubacterium ventriosum]|nr:tRNA (adenosine(37)-N6)-dimethylallyltransferase MiaA [Eubacterium ventriosum]